MPEPQITILWREIESITPPEPIFLAATDEVVLVPTPEPPGLPDKAAPTGLWIAAGLVVGALVALLVMAPHLWWFALLPLAGVVAWHLIRGRARRGERQHRKALLVDAQQRYAAVAAEADQLGPAGFAQLRGRLDQLKNEYEVEVPDRQREALVAFESEAQARQLQHYLEASDIRDAVIVGLGRARKSTLEQYGISSAAQVRADRIQNLPGFGVVLTTSVLAWREARARAFRFKPQEPATARERAAVIAPFDARRVAIAASLQQGHEDLQRMSRLPGDQRLEVAQRLAAALQGVEQAKLNVSAL